MRHLTMLLALVAGWMPSRSVLAQEHPSDPAAMKALVEVVQAYRKRPALTVKEKVSIVTAQGEAASRPQQEVEARITFTKETKDDQGNVSSRGVVQLRGFTCHLGGGELRIVHDATDHSYFSMADDGSPYYAMLNQFLDLPFPHLAIAFGERDVDDFFCMQFHPKAPWARPTSVADETTADGKKVRRIKLTSDDATVDVLVDPQTKLLESVEAKITGGDLVPEGASLTYKHTFEYETYEATPFDPSVLEFDPQRRQRVDLLAALQPPPPEAPAGAGGAEAGGLIGQPAPPLVLATADGGAVDLQELRGQVVILDFWATWCGPCRKALPDLHEVSRWAKDAALPVRVITVNVFEKRPPDNTPDARLESVRKFWEANRFTLPVAMDYTDEVAQAYGVRGIPATFVVRSDGVVHAVHSGFSAEYQQELKAEVQAALDAVK